MGQNLYALLRSRFEGAADRVALRQPGGPTLTYDQLDHRSAQLAGALADAGAAVGDRVVVQADKSTDTVALYLACLRAGLVHVPLNTAYTADEVGYFLSDARPRVFVCRRDADQHLSATARQAGVANVETLDDAGGGTLAEQAADQPGDTPVVDRSEDDVAALLYTSGTTGRSKGAMLTHRNLASNGTALHDLWGFGPDDVLVHALPVFHVHGLFVALHCALLSGCEVRFLPRFDVAQVRAELASSTVLMGVPTFYSRLLADPGFGADDCRRVRLFTCGSAPLTEVVFDAFTQRTGHTICERYGMTEAGIITSNPLDGPRIAGTVGYALPGVELRVVDGEGGAVAPGERGIVEVRGPGVFAGYWDQPAKTAEALGPDGFLHTGDVGTLAADGRLSLVGRSSDLIITGGYNVYPKEVELVLDSVPGVAEAAVVGLADPDFGEAVTAFVVRAPGSEVAAEDLEREVQGRLARFKHPKRYVFVEDLPRNAMGKVQKAVLRQQG